MNFQSPCLTLRSAEIAYRGTTAVTFLLKLRVKHMQLIIGGHDSLAFHPDWVYFKPLCGFCDLGWRGEQKGITRVVQELTV